MRICRIVATRILISSSIAFAYIAPLLAFAQAAIPAQSPTARALAQRSLNAMGGFAAWKNTSGAIAQVEIENSRLNTRKVTWYDDWSQDRHRYRRELRDDSKKSVISGSSKAQFVYAEDAVTLATGYPAAALMLSLNRPTCGFYAGSAEAGDGMLGTESIVIQRCFNASYSSETFEIRWVFDTSTGLPIRATLPVHAMVGRATFTRAVHYLSFQKQQDLLLPLRIQVSEPSGQTETIVVSQTTLSASLPSDTFTHKTN